MFFFRESGLSQGLGFFFPAFASLLNESVTYCLIHIVNSNNYERTVSQNVIVWYVRVYID